MKRATAAQIGSRITQAILESIYDHLANSVFDVDEGEVRLIDRDESCLYFGLFETDAESGNTQTLPCVIWTIEVSADVE